MAWSIFQYGDAGATAWAVELCAALGLQATPDRLRFIFDWEKSEGGGGKYNPLNQGPVPNNPGLTSTGQQYGGGAADFVSWQAGIQGAVAYLNMPNYQGVLAAMRGGNYQAMANTLWQSPWAASHYGYGSNWATTNYIPMSPAQIAGTASSMGLSGAGMAAGAGAPAGGGGVAAAGATGGQVTSTPGNTIGGQPLTMADIPTVVRWIRQNWAAFSWLLNIPEVAHIIEASAVQNLSPDQVQAKIQSTNWWRTTSAALRQAEQDRFMNPADWNFNAPGSKAAQMLSQIENTAATLGVQLTPGQMQQLALQALQFNWSSQQIQQNIGHGATAGNAQQVMQQINAMANQYYQTLSPQSEELWMQQIAGGTRTLQEFQSQMAHQAAMKWTGYAQQLQSGYTMQQLTDNLRQKAATTMEVDPSSIDFRTNPTYQKIIDFAPPVPAGATQLPQHRVMTESEMEQYLKGTHQWDFTQQARDQAGKLEQTITQDLGKLPGATI